MTPSEFKSWFEGFSESLENPPNKKQWERIKSCVTEIDGKPTSEKVFIDRYLATYVPTYIPYPYYHYSRPNYIMASTSSIASYPTNFGGCNPGNVDAITMSTNSYVFDSNTAMYTLGKEDYLNG